MGDIGQPSRFLALKYGAPWIYAAFNKERGIAPGLPSFDEFRTHLSRPSRSTRTRRSSASSATRSAHSLSPLLHNHMYKKLGRQRRSTCRSGCRAGSCRRRSKRTSRSRSRVQRHDPAQGSGRDPGAREGAERAR